MELKRRLSLVIAIMSVALGSGHLVQNVLVKPEKLAAAEPQPVDIELVAAGPDIVLPGKEPAIAQLIVPSFSAVSEQDAPSLFTLPTESLIKAEFGSAIPETDVAANECPIDLQLLVEPSAMIGLKITAPCNANQRVVLRHAGLAVTGKTSSAGELEVSLPAFGVTAEVTVRFPAGQTVTSTVTVPEAEALRRYGVQWLGDDAFQLHAFENGAGYGERGHVSDADPQRPLAGMPQVGGFMLVLGDDQVDLPMLAEVYTYPLDQDAPVRIVVEAAITKKTCAREILGETLAEVGGEVTITDLTLSMPDCSAVGDILVLNNIDPDLKIASAN